MKTYLFDYRLSVNEEDEDIFNHRISYFEKRSVEIRNYISANFPRFREIQCSSGIFLIASDKSAEDLGVEITKSFIFEETDFWILVEVNLQNSVVSADFLRINWITD